MVVVQVNIALEVLLKVFRDTAPVLQQPGVDVLLVLDVGTPGAKEVLDGLHRQLPGLLVVLAAVTQGRTAPLVIDDCADRLGVLDGLAIGVYVRLQDIGCAGAE